MTSSLFNPIQSLPTYLSFPSAAHTYQSYPNVGDQRHKFRMYISKCFKIVVEGLKLPQKIINALSYLE